MTDEVKWEFLDEKPVRLIIALEKLEKPYANEISAESGLSFQETINLLNRLSVTGIVESRKRAGKRKFQLTALGEALSLKIEGINEIFEKWPGAESEEIRP